MAVYFKLTNTTPVGIVQTNKSKNKKVFYNFQFKFIIDQDADVGDEVNDIANVLSLPIWSDHFVLQNVTVNKQFYYIVNDMSVYLGDQNTWLPEPARSEILRIGFSDSEINVNFPYQDQNMIWLPLAPDLVNFVHPYNLNYKHRFLFEKKANFLNCYIRIATFSTGDVTNFYTLLNTWLVTASGVANSACTIMGLRFNILVSGIMDN